MIKAKDAIAAARSLIGTPYSEMDCMALIRAVIKKSPGGVSDYRCAGTNWLWKSISNSGKYRHLTWRQESLDGAKAGMLAFKKKGDDVHHVGLVTQKRTVIHSSSAAGCVVETVLDGTWQLLARHRDIGTEESDTEESRAGEAPAKENKGETTTLISEETGDAFTLMGRWRIARD